MHDGWYPKAASHKFYQIQTDSSLHECYFHHTAEVEEGVNSEKKFPVKKL